MRYPRRSSSSSTTSSANRLGTVFKKTSEITILCEVEACAIYYGPDGELQTWPKDKDKVRDIALRYRRLNESLRRKKSVTLYGFLNKKKIKDLNILNKIRKASSLNKGNVLKYPISDHYSSDQTSHLIHSLELNISKFQERLRFIVESQKQHKEPTLLDHPSLPSSSSLNHQPLLQTQSSLNPSSQFSLPPMYYYGDSSLPQRPVSASYLNNQNFSASLQESVFRNHLMQQHRLYGYEQSMCTSAITNNSFQHPCFSYKEAVPESVNYFGLNQLMQKKFHGCDQNIEHTVQEESVNNIWLNQLMQHDFYGYQQNMLMSDIPNSNVPDPGLSNTASFEFCSDFQW